MKYAFLIFTGLLMGCGHPQVPIHKTVEKATNADCQNVYQYILTLTINNLDEGHAYSKRQHDALAWEVEQHYQRDGCQG